VRLIDFFGRGAALYPDRDCFHDGVRGATYGDAARASNRIANALIAAGFSRGSVIATYAPN
jgi:acyl-CoA synthetase (AMP-forming)/AMP-acid ligase II